MSYVIKQDGERWLIFSGGVCILACRDETTAAQTVAKARALLTGTAVSDNCWRLTFRSSPDHAPRATTIAARYG
jgi:hypothetical protein